MAPERDAEATFAPIDDDVVDEARRFLADELWAADLLDSSEPVLELIDEVADLVDDALVAGDTPVQARTDLATGSVEVVVEATPATTVAATPFDPSLLEVSLVDVIDRRADLPRPVELITIRVRLARRFRRGDGSARAARRRPAIAASRRRRRRPPRPAPPR